jgi:hypothetical protein
MATPQRGPRAASRQGDVTGQRAKALAEEHEAVVNDRRDEISTITHTQRRVRDEGVVDLTGDAPVLEVPDDLRDEAESTLEPLPEPVGAGKNINNGPRGQAARPWHHRDPPRGVRERPGDDPGAVRPRRRDAGDPQHHVVQGGPEVPAAPLDG